MNIRTRNMLKAAKYLENSACTDRKWRPGFHLSPMTGWMNDPNGLCQFNGEYHIFFQYSPFDTKPGTNYWGHYLTKDLIHYDYLPPALCCDIREDCHGVYSGSAVAYKGRMHLFYTGNVKQTGEYDFINAGREHNTIHISSEDGVNFGQKEILMRNSDYPKDMSCHIRDPKVWRENGLWQMALGARTKSGEGKILIYTSENMTDWTHTGTVSSEENYGYMWECPDVFTLNGTRFITFSPQGIEASGELYNNVYQSGYCLLDDISGEVKITGFTELDRGFDFYAPQTFEDESGRRILIGWLGMPDIDGIYENPTHEYGWMHMLTIPRELYAKNGKLCQKPVSELKALRKSEIRADCGGEYVSDSAKGIFEAEIKVKYPEKPLELTVKNDMKIEFDGKMLSLSFGSSGMGRTKRSVKMSRLEDIRIFCDRSSVEIFANRGEEVFSSRFYPGDNECGFAAKGECSIVIYPLDSFEITDKFSLGGQ